MQDGIIPNNLKISKIIPIYKSDDVKSVSNYRPISILPAFSKIIEKLVYNRLLDLINIHNILSNNQYGFLERISTSLALIELNEKITTSTIDNNEYSIGIIFRLSKGLRYS